MSHLDFIKQIKNLKTENRFKISTFNVETKEFAENSTEFQYSVIGRNPDCNVKLISDKCSRYHCIVYFTEDSLNIRDLDSKVGTYIGKLDAKNNITDKQQLPSFTQLHLHEKDCIIIEEQVFVIEQIKIYKLNTEKPLVFEPSKCQFCGVAVQLYGKEIQQIADQIQLLDTVFQKTSAILSQEEEKAIQILTKLDQVAEAHQCFLTQCKDCEKEEPKEVAFKSKISVINKSQAQSESEVPKEQLKSVKNRKNTPFQKAIQYEDEE